jgi:hypothetical protein
MFMLMQFVSEPFRLIFAVDETSPVRWTTLYLSTPEAVRELGAESWQMIVKGLQRAFAPAGLDVAGEFGGHPAKWAMSLSEVHSALYVVESLNKWIWQNSAGEVEAELFVPPALAANWAASLEAPRVSLESKLV